MYVASQNTRLKDFLQTIDLYEGNPDVRIYEGTNQNIIDKLCYAVRRHEIGAAIFTAHGLHDRYDLSDMGRHIRQNISDKGTLCLHFNKDKADIQTHNIQGQSHQPAPATMNRDNYPFEMFRKIKAVSTFALSSKMEFNLKSPGLIGFETQVIQSFPESKAMTMIDEKHADSWAQTTTHLADKNKPSIMLGPYDEKSGEYTAAPDGALVYMNNKMFHYSNPEVVEKGQQTILTFTHYNQGALSDIDPYPFPR